MAALAAGILSPACLILAPSETQLQGALLTIGLTWASAVDIDRLILPDILTLGLLVIGLGIAALSGPDILLRHAIGAACGYVFLSLVARAYRQMRNRTGLGQGDAKLFAAAGAWLGWAPLPWVMIGAALAALAFAGVLALLRRPAAINQPLAFGPFLAIGVWTAWMQAASGIKIFQ